MGNVAIVLGFVIGVPAIIIIGLLIYMATKPTPACPLMATGSVTRQTGASTRHNPPRPPPPAALPTVPSSRARALNSQPPLTNAQRAMVASGTDSLFRESAFLSSGLDPIRPSAASDLELLFDSSHVLNTAVGTPLTRSSQTEVLSSLS